jgi:Ca2+-binding RTX toxin-like protein
LANTITGGTNADALLGLAENDTILGGAGNDTITGGADADQLTGGADNDTFIFALAVDTFRAGFAAADTTTVNIDRITDFVGNGALAGDTIQIATAIAAATTGAAASVTAFTVASANNFNDLAGALAGIQVSVAGGAGVGLLSVADITVSAGALAGRYMVVNDAVAGYTAGTDIVIGLTGITGALNALDFTVV